MWRKIEPKSGEKMTNIRSALRFKADLHMKPPSTMGHKSLIQRRPSLNHPGWLQYLFRHTIRYSKLPYLLSSGLIGRKKEIQTSFCAKDVLLPEIMCSPARVIFAMPNIPFFSWWEFETEVIAFKCKCENFDPLKRPVFGPKNTCFFHTPKTNS